MPTDLTVVDGNAVGVLQSVVLNERKILKREGIFVVIILLNQRTRMVKKSPDIIPRGLVYLQDSKTLIHRARHIAKRSVERNMQRGRSINIDTIKRNLVREMRNFLYSEIKKRPIIVPVVFISR